ncbi:MAG: Tol-Pal system protein TolB [Candidatus Melainabacteria bacterium]|nr:Tol-Pal system protein TolB [Candidatus Melainabacteria bacterium]
MMKTVFALAILISSIGVAEESPEIRVQLATASPLQPVYIGKIQMKATSIEPSYAIQLENVLNYDLNYNGSTKVSPRSSEKEQLILTKDNSEAFNPAVWKKMGISYAVRCEVTGRTLTAYAFNVQTGSLKTFSDIPLTGDISQDRKQIHKLADGIHKSFFNKEGVASSRILFSYQVKNPRADGSEWISEIWECDWDGANSRQLTHDASYCVTPVAVPHNSRYNNDRFLYVSYKMGQPKIFIGSLKGGEGRRLIDLRGNQLLPTISLQRDKIAFICDAGGRTDLFMQPLNPETGEVGKPVQLYSYPRSTQASPTFSPDGSKIAFVSDKDGGMRIYIIPASASEKRANAQMISKQNRENSCPAWSPDGTKLAYSAKSNGIRQVWIYEFATGEEWQLTTGSGNKENPYWAPDSKHLVFNSTDATSSELFIVNLNQPEAVKISRGPGKKHYPTWGAR